MLPGTLTRFRDGASFLTDGWPAAHLRARAQVELIPAVLLQITQDPLCCIWCTDVHRFQLTQSLIIYKNNKKDIEF